MEKLLFFDTETTGLPIRRDAPASDIQNWPRLAQIAFAQYDIGGNLLLEESYLVKPQGFIIPESSTVIHGITHNIAQQSGIDLETVLRRFEKYIQDSDFIIAHNLEFDSNVITAECHRSNHNVHLLMQKKTFCTMVDMNITGKPPKLSEWYQSLFNEEIIVSHDALADVRLTATCFWQLVKTGEVQKKPIYENGTNSVIDWIFINANTAILREERKNIKNQDFDFLDRENTAFFHAIELI